MSYKVVLNSTDISDYVVSASPVPYISRNSDYTPRYEFFNLSIARTISDLGFTSIPIGDTIKVLDETDAFIFGGYIVQSKFNYETHEYEINVETSLSKLKDTKFGYDQMHTWFKTGLSTQYWTDYRSRIGVSVLWALQCAFSVNGLTMDEGTLFSEILFEKTAHTGWDGRVVTYGALYFDEYQLYCLNMSTAADPATTISEYVIRVANPVSAEVENILIYKGNHEPEITCADFVEEVLTSLKLTLKQTDLTKFGLMEFTANYTTTDIPEDNRYSYEVENVFARSSDVGISTVDYDPPGDVWSSSSTPRDKYYSLTEIPLNELNLGGDDKINIMKNFAIYFADTTNYSAPYHESVCVMELSGTFISGTGSANAKLNIASARYNTLGVDKTQEQIKSPIITTYKTVIENFINLEDRTSEIVQEAFT